jgi:hypothetical protein
MGAEGVRAESPQLGSKVVKRKIDPTMFIKLEGMDLAVIECRFAYTKLSFLSQFRSFSYL